MAPGGTVPAEFGPPPGREAQSDHHASRGSSARLGRGGSNARGYAARPITTGRALEVRAGIEPTFADLQSAASPLCHRTSARGGVYRVCEAKWSRLVPIWCLGGGGDTPL